MVYVNKKMLYSVVNTLHGLHFLQVVIFFPFLHGGHVGHDISEHHRFVWLHILLIELRGLRHHGGFLYTAFWWPLPAYKWMKCYVGAIQLWKLFSANLYQHWQLFNFWGILSSGHIDCYLNWRSLGMFWFFLDMFWWLFNLATFRSEPNQLSWVKY